MNMKESGITAFDDNGVTRVTIQCGGKIASMMGVYLKDKSTVVDFIELTNNVGAGNTICEDTEAEINKPSVRIAVNDSKSWMSIIKSLAQAYIVQKAMEDNPNLGDKEIIDILDGSEYSIEISKLKK